MSLTRLLFKINIGPFSGFIPFRPRVPAFRLPGDLVRSTVGSTGVNENDGTDDQTRPFASASSTFSTANGLETKPCNRTRQKDQKNEIVSVSFRTATAGVGNQPTVATAPWSCLGSIIIWKKQTKIHAESYAKVYASCTTK